MDFGDGLQEKDPFARRDEEAEEYSKMNMNIMLEIFAPKDAEAEKREEENVVRGWLEQLEKRDVLRLDRLVEMEDKDWNGLSMPSSSQRILQGYVAKEYPQTCEDVLRRLKEKNQRLSQHPVIVLAFPDAVKEDSNRVTEQKGEVQKGNDDNNDRDNDRQDGDNEGGGDDDDDEYDADDEEVKAATCEDVGQSGHICNSDCEKKMDQRMTKVWLSLQKNKRSSKCNQLHRLNNVWDAAIEGCLFCLRRLRLHAVWIDPVFSENALFYCVRARQTKAVKLLLRDEKKERVDFIHQLTTTKNPAGQTAYDLACALKFDDVAGMIKAASVGSASSVVTNLESPRMYHTSSTGQGTAAVFLTEFAYRNESNGAKTKEHTWRTTLLVKTLEPVSAVENIAYTCCNWFGCCTWCCQLHACVAANPMVSCWRCLSFTLFSGLPCFALNTFLVPVYTPGVILNCLQDGFKGISPANDSTWGNCCCCCCCYVSDGKMMNWSYGPFQDCGPLFTVFVPKKDFEIVGEMHNGRRDAVIYHPTARLQVRNGSIIQRPPPSTVTIDGLKAAPHSRYRIFDLLCCYAIEREGYYTTRHSRNAVKDYKGCCEISSSTSSNTSENAFGSEEMMLISRMKDFDPNSDNNTIRIDNIKSFR